MTQAAERDRLSIVIVGHVDHGKSTVVGRLLADTGSLPKGKLEQVKEYCARNSKPFEFAFLLDALKDEQSQGITIDVARIFFKTTLRDYMIIDAPGHIEFVKNMVSGASHAKAALLVIDAAEGVRENSKRHGYLLQMLGIKQVGVLINKMDCVGYAEERFQAVVDEYRRFLDRIGIQAMHFIPTAAFHGESITTRSSAMPWYRGPNVIELLDRFQVDTPPADKPFRMPVQEIYKFTSSGDDRRIVAGTVEAGTIRVGDEMVFYPSGKTSTVKSLERFPTPTGTSACAGEAVGFTLTEEVYIRRGEIATRKDQSRPLVARRMRASVFWLGREPLASGREYVLKLGTARIRARLEQVVHALDGSSLDLLSGRKEVRRHEAAECIFELDAPLAFDHPDDNSSLGRFVLVDGYEISGGGLIREALEDRSTYAREMVILRNLKWRKSFVGLPEREEKLGQRACVALVTGSDDELRRETAKELERRLFAEGRSVYFLGIGSILYGIDADIRVGGGNHAEDIRRLAEVAHILVDAGLILIVTASRLGNEDVDLIRTVVDAAKVLTIWVGPDKGANLTCELRPAGQTAAECVDEVCRLLVSRKFIENS